MTSWSPSGNRNRTKVKKRWREKQAREYLKGLTKHQLVALKTVLEENEMPEELTLQIWEDIKEPTGLDKLGVLLGEKLGM